MNQAKSSGPRYLIRGFSLLTEPGIRAFVVLPLTINILVLGGFSYFSLRWMGGWIEQTLAYLPGWLDFLGWLLWPLAVLLVLATTMYFFSTVANLIAAPFNGLLSEKLEEKLTGNRDVGGRETIGQTLASFPRSIGREIGKLWYYLGFAILVLILSFVLSPLAPILWFLLNAWMMAIEYCDYPMDNHRLGFKDARRRLSSQRGHSFGFGAAVMLGTMIPVLNLFVMPAAVCGGTLMWIERLQQPGAASR